MRTIAIGFVALVLAQSGASAQTADERARILRDFEQRVADYTQQQKWLDLSAEALPAATSDPVTPSARRGGSMPAPRIFTPPVAMVFRQDIAAALRNPGPAISGVGAFPHPQVLEPFPATELHDFPAVLHDALPPLPAPLEYRLIGHDLVVRDKEADIIVGVLRDALGSRLTVIR